MRRILTTTLGAALLLTACVTAPVCATQDLIDDSLGQKVDRAMRLVRDLYLDRHGLHDVCVAAEIRTMRPDSEWSIIAVRITQAIRGVPVELDGCASAPLVAEVAFHFLHDRLKYVGASGPLLDGAAQMTKLPRREDDAGLLEVLKREMGCQTLEFVRVRQESHLPRPTRLYKVGSGDCRADPLEIVAATGVLLWAGVP